MCTQLRCCNLHMRLFGQLPRELQYEIWASAAALTQDLSSIRATGKTLASVFKVRAFITGLCAKTPTLVMNFFTIEVFMNDFFDGTSLSSNDEMVSGTNRMFVAKLQRAHQLELCRGVAFRDDSNLSLPIAIERGLNRLHAELRLRETSNI